MDSRRRAAADCTNCDDRDVHGRHGGHDGVLSGLGSEPAQRHHRHKATIRIDRTQPSITSPGFGRPPDHGDWFNHPVAFQFIGQDATSGIESCTGGTYGGPDGVGVGISGTCRDVAGNVTSGGFGLNYDATPPPKPTVSVLPG